MAWRLLSEVTWPDMDCHVVSVQVAQMYIEFHTMHMQNKKVKEISRVFVYTSSPTMEVMVVTKTLMWLKSQE